MTGNGPIYFLVVVKSSGMPLQAEPSTEVSFEAIITGFVSGIIGAIPKILAEFQFLLIPYLGIKVVLLGFRHVLHRVYPEFQKLVVNLSVLIVALFL